MRGRPILSYMRGEHVGADIRKKKRKTSKDLIFRYTREYK